MEEQGRLVEYIKLLQAVSRNAQVRKEKDNRLVDKIVNK
jgi:hypothetical protein